MFAGNVDGASWNTCTGASTAFGANALWVAAYGVSSPPLPAGWASWTFWQYTSSATIPGIAGNVDASYSNGAIAALVAPQQPGGPVTGGRARDAAHGVVNW